MTDQSLSYQALELLIAGNLRFANSQTTGERRDESTRRKMTADQQPFAIIFGCIDSRVPPEIIFDQGLGDLLVIRTAGEVLDDATLGSIEFGVAWMGIPLIIVLGHTDCGAIKATIASMKAKDTPPGKIAKLVSSIQPIIDRAGGADLSDKNQAVRVQVEHVVDMLKKSPIITHALAAQKLRVVGAVYELESGLVRITVP